MTLWHYLLFVIGYNLTIRGADGSSKIFKMDFFNALNYVEKYVHMYACRLKKKFNI